MNHFTRNAEGVLVCEQLRLSELAQRFGTPVYVYSAATLRRHAAVMRDSIGAGNLACYAVKANSNLAILGLLSREGLGFDIVSQGELERVLLAGGRADRVVFSGVGKTAAELERALSVGVFQFNVESAPELELLNAVAARLGKQARIGIRVNPEVDAKTHPYISTGLKESKFGVTFDVALQMYARAKQLPHLLVRAVTCHIGSQITELAPFATALEKVLSLIGQLRNDGHTIDTLDFGGGLGVRYQNETPPDPASLGSLVRERASSMGLRLLIEPGRVIVANSGVLVCKVLHIKESAHKNFVVVDAAMNDLMRPALYGAHHEIEPVGPVPTTCLTADVVGPVCESSDFLAKARTLPMLQANDLVCVRGAGAYGFSMSSQYNSRPRVAEVLVNGDKVQLIREREQLTDLWRLEHPLSPDM